MAFAPIMKARGSEDKPDAWPGGAPGGRGLLVSGRTSVVNVRLKVGLRIWIPNLEGMDPVFFFSKMSDRDPVLF